MWMIQKKEGSKLKSLSTRPRRNFLLIVRVRLGGRRNLTIPLSLWALEESFEAVSDMAWLGERILRFGARRRLGRPGNKWSAYIKQMPVSAAIDQVGEILRDLRKLGRFRIVEVEDHNTRVYIDLF